MRIRQMGAAMLIVCAMSVTLLYSIRHAMPGHGGTAVELLLGLVSVVTGMGGMLMVIAGATLLEPDVWPPRD